MQQYLKITEFSAADVQEIESNTLDIVPFETIVVSSRKLKSVVYTNRYPREGR